MEALHLQSVPVLLAIGLKNSLLSRGASLAGVTQRLGARHRQQTAPGNQLPWIMVKYPRRCQVVIDKQETICCYSAICRVSNFPARAPRCARYRRCLTPHASSSRSPTANASGL